MLGFPLLPPAFATMRDSMSQRYAAWRLSPIQTLALTFVLVILTGTSLLTLPIMQQPGARLSLLDCLFTATSATTVTGLVTVSTADSWSRFGQGIILILMQVGGLGYMTIATVLALLLGVRVGLHTRLQLTETLGAFSLRDTVRVLRFIGVGTLAIEGIAALVLAARFHGFQGWAWGHAIFEGIFYAVSGFCNAGFDLAPGLQGLAYAPYRTDMLLLTVLGVLIILGGLGFGVLVELDPFQHRVRRRLGLHAKLVLAVSAILIVGGAALFLLFEWGNPDTLAAIPSAADRIVMGAFMAVTARTAGFSPFDLSLVSPLTLFLLMILMVIGTAPGSTGGGVRVTTVAVIILAIAALVQKRPDVEAFGRRIGGETVRLAISLFALYLLAVMVTIAFLSYIEINLAGIPPGPVASALFGDLAFLVMSAFGTVGLHSAIPPELTTVSRVILILAMFIGRLGPLAFVFVFAQPKRPMLRRLPSEPVIAG